MFISECCRERCEEVMRYSPRKAGEAACFFFHLPNRIQISVQTRTRVIEQSSILSYSHRYVKTFTPLSPTLSQISQHHFERNPERVRNLRPDSFSQVLGLANIRPGGRYLIVDSTGGLLAGGCLERMGGEFHVCSRNEGKEELLIDRPLQGSVHEE